MSVNSKENVESSQDRCACAVGMVNQEGVYLDDCDWKAWLEMYDEECTFWIPAWLSETERTTDPDNQISIIYHDDKKALEERVSRLTSRKPVTTMPLPRTTHFLSNVIARAEDEVVIVTANWSVMIYMQREAKEHVLFGRYIYKIKTLRDQSGRVTGSIKNKTVILVNDRVPTLLDFYCV